MWGDLQMKTIPERNTVKISLQKYDEMCLKVLEDGAKQGVCLILYLLSTSPKDKWGEKRLRELFDRANDFLQLPQTFLRDMTGDDVINYMKEKYGIDVDELKVKVDLRDNKNKSNS